MANTNNPHGFRYEHSLRGPEVVLQTTTLASGVGVIAGDPIGVSSGKGILAVTTTASILGVAAETITASAGVEKECKYIPADESNVFSIQADGNFTAGLNYSARSITGSTGKVVLDTDDTDPGIFQVHGLKSGSAWGTYAQVLGVFKKSAFSGQA